MDTENSAAPESARVSAITINLEEKPATEQSTAHDPSLQAEQIETTTQDTAMQDTDAEPGPQLTHALEALLGGLDSPMLTPEESTAPVAALVEAKAEDPPIPADETVPATSIIPIIAEEPLRDQVPVARPQVEPMQNAPARPSIPGLFLGQNTALPVPEMVQNDTMSGIDAPAALPVAHLPTSDSSATVTATEPTSEDTALTTAAVTTDHIPGDDTLMGEDAPVEGEQAEWEVDSSPIESSSDDSSSDSSSESEDGDNTYKLLSPEEQARILMEGDGGSDDEGGGKSKGAGGQLRTKNEVPEVVVPKPDVTITAEMPITELGVVEHIVGNILLVTAKTSGEYRVLEVGSVLCLGDRSVVGAVAETLGRVQQPLYSVMFTNAGEITTAGLAVGTTVFYSDQHSTYVFTQALKAYKGSDASNLHDEEVGDEEMEFSDDEAEAEHKRRVKQKRIERRGGKMQQNGAPSRGGRHPLQQSQTPYDASSGLSYDDVEEDGPYKPLARPVGFAASAGHAEAPQEGAYSGGYDRPNQHRDQGRGRGRGNDRGRGDRGRGRGDRGRGRGAQQDRRGGGHSLPPRPQNAQPPSPYQPPGFPPQQQQTPGQQFSHPSSAAPAMPNFYMPPTAAYSPNQPQMPWPQFPVPPQFQQQFQNMQNGWPNPPPGPQASPAPGGAFINPAFLPGAWNPQGGSGTGK